MTLGPATRSPARTRGGCPAGHKMTGGWERRPGGYPRATIGGPRSRLSCPGAHRPCPGRVGGAAGGTPRSRPQPRRAGKHPAPSPAGCAPQGPTAPQAARHGGQGFLEREVPRIPCRGAQQGPTQGTAGGCKAPGLPAFVPASLPHRLRMRLPGSVPGPARLDWAHMCNTLVKGGSGR